MRQTHVMAMLAATGLAGISSIALGVDGPRVAPSGGKTVLEQDVLNSIVTDELWTDHEVVPNRVFVRFGAEIVGERREALLAEMGAAVSSSYERMVPGTCCLAIDADVANNGGYR